MRIIRHWVLPGNSWQDAAHCLPYMFSDTWWERSWRITLMQGHCHFISLVQTRAIAMLTSQVLGRLGRRRITQVLHVICITDRVPLRKRPEQFSFPKRLQPTMKTESCDWFMLEPRRSCPHNGRAYASSNNERRPSCLLHRL